MDTLSIPTALTTSLSAFGRKALFVTAVVIAATVASSALLAGCEKKGPVEKAGAAVDKGVKKAGDAVENAGDKVKDATR